MFLFIILINQLFSLTFCANILAITNLPSPSHHIFHDVYLLELAKRGHNITLLGHDNDKHHHPNYTHLVMKNVYETVRPQFNPLDMYYYTPWQSIRSICQFSAITCTLDLKSTSLKALQNYPSNFSFDLIIWDMNSSPCLIPLLDKFHRPPVVGVNPFINQPNLFKNIYQSHMPFYLNKMPMSFWQRAENAFWKFALEINTWLFCHPAEKELAENYFEAQYLNVSEFYRNISLVLLNYHPVVNYIEALPPNIIPVGGLHIQQDILPKKLQQILDAAQDGAILMSLGSNIKASHLGNNTLNSILKTFAKLKQTIIWKNEYNFDNNELPKNIYVQKWLPQSAVLGHKNVKLFISHSGMLSSHEAVYHGVPVLGMPFYLDQFTNIAALIEKGIAKKVLIDQLTEESFYENIQEMFKDPKFQRKADELSVLYKDREKSPLETAIYWIEYILRHKSVKHLDMATRDLSFVQLYNLDLIFALFTAQFVVLLSIFYVFNKIKV